MAGRSPIPRLTDIVEAIEHIRSITEGITLEEFAADWQKKWLVERGIEIVSEASRHLPDSVKGRHPEIPWSKVAAVGNILRHEYERIAPAILWTVARSELLPLEKACRTELVREHENAVKQETRHPGKGDSAKTD
jgi:uncharacterized protein with HEPN domain